MSFRYRLFRGLLRKIHEVLFGFTVHGAERVPETGPVILAANHRRYADPVLVCMCVPRRIQWMGKKELFTPRSTGFSTLSAPSPWTARPEVVVP